MTDSARNVKAREDLIDRLGIDESVARSLAIKLHEEHALSSADPLKALRSLLRKEFEVLGIDAAEFDMDVRKQRIRFTLADPRLLIELFL